MATLGRYGGDRRGSTSATATSAPTCTARSGSAEGATLTEVTAEIAAAWGLGLRLLPVTDDPLRTLVTVRGRRPRAEVGFQEYFVQRQHAVPVRAVRFAGAEAARPAPGVLEAIAGADTMVIAPSNPIVSIGPVLAVPGVREAVVGPPGPTSWPCRRSSPAPPSRARPTGCCAELGHEASVVGVARLYAPLASALVIDEADAGPGARGRGRGHALRRGADDHVRRRRPPPARPGRARRDRSIAA